MFRRKPSFTCLPIFVPQFLHAHTFIYQLTVLCHISLDNDKMACATHVLDFVKGLNELNCFWHTLSISFVKYIWLKLAIYSYIVKHRHKNTLCFSQAKNVYVYIDILIIMLVHHNIFHKYFNIYNILNHSIGWGMYKVTNMINIVAARKYWCYILVSSAIVLLFLFICNTNGAIQNSCWYMQVLWS